ncbi:hypothetical protein N0V93_003880 [Gnomoniopsis smithogilvyi]|uniref:Rhodopsin domain-containing protein n=1 Tax=Gnomoniopsis smithogilvyi TaxID=1191159 RepID=A0A9W9CZJ9_9PEZI|nr:hypothetical protein N0V93_003880 [Gnomoniopsis smithogilvyi]
MSTSLYASIGSVNNLNEPTPFFDHAEVMYGFVIACLILSSCCTGLRVYVRFFVTCCPGIDDVFIIALFLSTLVASIGSCVLVKHGLGQHFVLLDTQAKLAFDQTFWWSNGGYNMGLMFVKLSLLTQYLRLFEENPHIPLTRKLRKITLIFIAISSLWGLAYSFLAWVPCVPVSGLWDPTQKALRYGYGSQNIDVFVGTYISHATTNMALDLAVFGIPLCSWSLLNHDGVEKKSRTALMGLYSLGATATMCSIIRFAVIVSNRATTSPEFDPSWYGGTSIGLSILEINIATIVAALPVFWPHLRRNIDRIMVTHEVEVRITTSSGFSQIEGDSKQGPSHWPAEDNKGGSEIIAMRPLRGANHSGDSKGFGAGMPFDGKGSYN